MSGDNTGPSVEEAIRQGLLRIVYQPIVDLGSLEVFAYEALVRSSVKTLMPPPRLFNRAVVEEQLGVLGRTLRRLSVDGCPDFPLFLNLHPAEFAEGWLVRPDDPIFEHPHPVYLEITESVPMTHYDMCFSVLAEVRSKDLRVAVDDLGAGYSNLRYIADLAPEVVKLDMSLVQGIGSNQRMFALVSNLVRLCGDLGARVVAEGIETYEDLETVWETGAHFGQGYYLARPGFPPPRVDRSELTAKA